MSPAIPADVLQSLLQLRHALQAAPPKGGERTRLIHAWAAHHGRHASTVHRWLAEHAGHDSGRKRRSDSGSTRMPTESLEFIAASMQQSVRGNGIATKPICVAMKRSAAFGMPPIPS